MSQRTLPSADVPSLMGKFIHVGDVLCILDSKQSEIVNSVAHLAADGGKVLWVSPPHAKLPSFADRVEADLARLQSGIPLDTQIRSPVDVVWIEEGSRLNLEQSLATIAKCRPLIIQKTDSNIGPSDIVSKISRLRYETAEIVLTAGNESNRYQLLSPQEKCMLESAGDGHFGTRTGPLVAISFYRTPELVDVMTRGLLRIKKELAALDARVVIYNDSPDDSQQAVHLEKARHELEKEVDCLFVENPLNRGFIQTMNSAMALAREHHRDIILLNSDAMFSPGALSEMVRVSQLDPMIGFVSPRSNNATIATAGSARFFDSEFEARQLERRIRSSLRYLPRYQYAPTAIGFCLLIKNGILRDFGDLSLEYGKGYNEENDYILRAGRCGFRAVIANWAYTQHVGEQSFGKDKIGRDQREKTNRQLLDRRYPEYTSLVENYVSSDGFRAEKFMTQLATDRVNLAIDASAIEMGFNGTIKLSIELIKRIAELYGTEMDISIIGDLEALQFHKIHDIKGARITGWDIETKFDVVLRLGQPFNTSALERMTEAAPVNVYMMLDTIALDCSQLYRTTLEPIWTAVMSTADGIIYNSKFTRDQFNRRFAIDPAVTAECVSYHSLDRADYLRPPSNVEHAVKHILIVGNHFPHKNVIPTLKVISEAVPQHRYVALAGSPGDFETENGRADKIYCAGDLEDSFMNELFQNAKAVVFPSYYEGFGFPIQEALANRLPIYVQDIAINREIHDIMRSPNIHFYAGFQELALLLKSDIHWVEEPERDASTSHDWSSSAREIVNFTLECLNRASLQSVKRRVEEVRYLRLSDTALRRARHPLTRLTSRLLRASTLKGRA